MFGARKKIETMVRTSFGKNPMEGYLYYNAEGRMDEVRRLHDALREMPEETGTTKWEVDDITWNDLEMDRIFQRVNHTNSFIGEQVLYRKMHLLNQDKSADRIEDFEKKLAYLKENPDERLEMELRLNGIGKHYEGYYLAEFLLNSDWWKCGNVLLYHTLQVFLVICFIGTVVFENPVAIVGLVLIALVNLMIYLFTKQKYEIYFSTLVDFKRIYDFSRWMEKKDRNNNIFVTEDVKRAIGKLNGMSRAILGMDGRREASMTGDAVAILREYIWGILLIDVSMFNHIMRIINDKQEEVITLLNFTGEIDGDISILSYRESVSGWCRPEFVQSGIAVEGIAHPLITVPVKNDFNLCNRAIITGANASGKSTFMKAMAINCILAQTIHTCMADRMHLQPIRIATCMALRDDIMTGESYYFREAKCIKRMLDLAVKESSVLLVIDEILKGTNTDERVAASKAILEYVSNTKCLVLVATHDIELTDCNAYTDYHFCSKIQGKDIVFDYLIHDGTAKQSNAIALLSYLGYPDTLVEKAKVNLSENR